MSEHWPEEPLQRIRTFLIEEHGWAKADEEAVRERCVRTVEAGAEAYLASVPLSPASMFEHLYARLPASLHQQRQAVERRHE